MKKTTATGALLALSVTGLLGVGASPALAASSGGGTLQVLIGTYPDSLDPDLGFTTQSQEADVAVYTPLLTYAQQSGVAGTRIIPGLAASLPTVTANGLTYHLTLRKGLVFSNGAPVVASDFAHGIERAIKLNWGGASFLTAYVVGAQAFADGKAKTVSGISTDDSTGAITINLSQPFGAFDNVLAFPGAAPVPKTTPMKPEPTHPPAGVGPYELSHVSANSSYTLVKNPRFAGLHLPGLSTGSVSKVQVTLVSNNTIEAQRVIANQADIFDPADTLPPGELSAAERLPKSRYSTVPQAETNFIFFDVRTAPFNKVVARQAVNMALDRTAMSRLAAGFSVPTCYFLPPNLPGHVDASCADGSPATVTPSAATLARAKAMIKNAGLAGTRVKVWSQTKEPQQEYMVYYTSLLKQLGFDATLRVVSDATYFQTVGNAKTAPQTGFLAWNQDFPDPSDFYALLAAQSIHPENSLNVGNVDDPHIQAELKKLDVVPSAELSRINGQWQALERYVSQEAYIAPFGNQTLPLLFSNRVASATFNPVDYILYASVKLH